MKNKNLILVLVAIYMLTNACNVSKTLEDGQYMVNSNSIQIQQGAKNLGEKEIKNGLIDIASPKPNTGLFKIPLQIYRLTKNRKKEKGLKNYLYKNFAEEPSIYDSKKVNLSVLKMEKYLLDNGFIGSTVSVDTITKKRNIEIYYNINAAERRTIKHITRISDTTSIGQTLNKISKYSRLKTGDYYSKSRLDSERKWIAEELRNRGYLDINQENIYFTVDTQFVEKVVDISINYKLADQNDTLIQYQLGKTFVHSIANEQSLKKPKPDTVIVKSGMYDIQDVEILRPKILDLTIDQDSSDFISIEKQQLTVNHFISYGLFKYVNEKYSDPYGDSLNILDRHIYLTAGPDASIGTEFELNNRSGNFFGAAVTGFFNNNNTFKGAEIFRAALTLGSEVQLNNNQSLLNTLIADLELGLDIPRLLIPFFYKKPSTFFIPHTKLSFSNLYESRLESYTALRSSFEFTYQWRETKKSDHVLSPISITYLNVLSTSSLFDERLDQDRRLFLSFQNIIDVGLEYAYTFTDQYTNGTSNYSYFNLTSRFSGNLLNNFLQETNANDQKTLFNTPLAEYSKLKLDYRYYIKFKKSKLISRINAGVAFAYGNADEVPYTEQFIVGGSQSLRGFNLRGLGPGSFVLDTIASNIVTNQFFDQTGDIILEANLEYRFPMFGFLKGAIFVDAGNVWLINSNPDKPGGLFQFDSFVNQIALNTGYGFRFDLDFIVIRLDLGAVLRRPYLNQGFEWTFNRTNAFSTSWFGENLNFQLGIGYPF